MASRYPLYISVWSSSTFGTHVAGLDSCAIGVAFFLLSLFSSELLTRHAIMACSSMLLQGTLE